MAGGRARVAVSILDADHSNMAYAIRRAEREGADRFHIDVMDGHFVPNLTFGPTMIKGIRPRTELPLDAHLMISDPLTFVDEFLEAGCDADKLREMEDRHLKVLAGRRLQLRLPRVERKVTERAGRHDHIRPRLLRLLDRLDQLA